MAIYESYFFLLFLTKLKIKGNEKKCDICVVFNPIKILIGWAHQNDRQNLSFLKAINVVGNKLAGITCKMANP